MKKLIEKIEKDFALQINDLKQIMINSWKNKFLS